MADLTEKEYAALDEKYTRELPALKRGVGGLLTRRREMRQEKLLQMLDNVAATYILTIAESHHQTPSQVIGEWAREKIAKQDDAAALRRETAYV
jgi:L-arabinose isomerase